MEDARHGAVLVTGSPAKTTAEVLASLTVDVVRRAVNDQMTVAVHVIDAADRSLIRLRQLDQTQQYVSPDDVDGVTALLAGVEARLLDGSAQMQLLILNELGPLLDFLQRLNRHDLVARIERLAAAHDRKQLMVAAAGPDEGSVPSSLGPTFANRLQIDAEQSGRILTGDGHRIISIDAMSGRDLTTSVACVLREDDTPGMGVISDPASKPAAGGSDDDGEQGLHIRSHRGGSSAKASGASDSMDSDVTSRRGRRAGRPGRIENSRAVRPDDIVLFGDPGSRLN